ncbi:hypothetical protein EV122DRAFT_212032, partial [Schizophyllum commune]
LGRFGYAPSLLHLTKVPNSFASAHIRQAELLFVEEELEEAPLVHNTPHSLVEPSTPSSSTETALAPLATAGGGYRDHIQHPDPPPGAVIALATSVYQPLATFLDIVGQKLGEAPLLRYDKGRRPALVVDSGVSEDGRRFCIALLLATFGGCTDWRAISDPISRWVIPARPAGGEHDCLPLWDNVPVHNMGREMVFVITLPINVYHIGVKAWECERYTEGGRELWVAEERAEELSRLADWNADSLGQELRTCPQYAAMFEHFNATSSWRPHRRPDAWGRALSYERPESAEEGGLHPAEYASPTAGPTPCNSPTKPRSRALPGSSSCPPSSSRAPSSSRTRPQSSSRSRPPSSARSRPPSSSRHTALSSPFGSPVPRALALEGLAPHDVGLAPHDIQSGHLPSHDVEPGELFEDEDDEEDDLPVPFLDTPQKMGPAASMRFDESPSRRYEDSYSAYYEEVHSAHYDGTPSRRYDESPFRRYDGSPSMRHDNCASNDFPSTPSRAPPRESFSSPTRAPIYSSRPPFSPLATYSPLPADVPQTPIRRNGRTMDFEMYEGPRQTDDFDASIAGDAHAVPDDFMDAFMADKFTTTEGYATTDDFMPVEGFTASQNFTAAPATPSLLERISTARTPKRRARNRRRNDNANERRNDNANERRNDSANERRNDNNANNVPITPRKRNGNNPNSIPLTPRKPLAPKAYTPHTPHSSRSSPYTPLKAPQLSSRGQRAFQPYPQSSPSKAGRSLLNRIAVPLKDRISEAVEPDEN